MSKKIKFLILILIILLFIACFYYISSKNNPNNPKLSEAEIQAIVNVQKDVQMPENVLNSAANFIKYLYKDLPKPTISKYVFIKGETYPEDFIYEIYVNYYNEDSYGYIIFKINKNLIDAVVEMSGGGAIHITLDPEHSNFKDPSNFINNIDIKNLENDETLQFINFHVRVPYYLKNVIYKDYKKDETFFQSNNISNGYPCVNYKNVEGEKGFFYVTISDTKKGWLCGDLIKTYFTYKINMETLEYVKITNT